MAEANPFRYRGYYYDRETGFYYLQSRYYDPATGRFLNADGYVNANGDIIGFNMYAYCGNNPVNRIDHKGEFSITLGLLFRVVAVAVCALAVAVLYPVVKETVEVVYKEVSDAVDKIEKAIQDENDNHPGEYYVYVLVNKKKEVEYVGRTKNPKARAEKHKNSDKTGGLEMVILYGGLTWSEARGLEQVEMIHYHTLNAARDVKKGFGRNWINGIRLSHPHRSAFFKAAYDYLYNDFTDFWYNLIGQ